jgi:hypothetical protein
MLDMTIIIWDLWLKLLITVLDIYGQCVFYWYNPNPPVVPCQFWWCSLRDDGVPDSVFASGELEMEWGDDRRVLTVAFAAGGSVWDGVDVPAAGSRCRSFTLVSVHIGFDFNNNNFYFYFYEMLWNRKTYWITLPGSTRCFASMSDLVGRICSSVQLVIWRRVMWR